MGVKKCPYCAEDIKTEAKVCYHCGRDINGPIIIKRVMLIFFIIWMIGMFFASIIESNKKNNQVENNIIQNSK